MGKSRKKPDSEVDSDPAAVASPATPIENEKQVVGNKKQKIDNGDKEQNFEKKNFGKETEENTKEEQKNSSEENKVEVPSFIESTPTTQDAKGARISNEHEEVEKDDNSKVDHQHLETPMESVESSPAINSAETAQHSKRARSSSEHEEEDGDDNSKEDHHHIETPMESVEVPQTINSEETAPDAKRARISNEYEEDRDDYSKEDQQQLETPNESAQTPLSSEAPGSKTVLMDNLSFSIQEKDVKQFFKNVGEIAEIHFEVKEEYFTGHGHVEFMTAEAAQEALKLNNTSLLDRLVKLELATGRDEHPTTASHATGSKTVFLGNLSFLIEEDDVRDFFKDVGEIAAIRFAIRNDRFLGHGYVEFTTAEAAQEALKLNQEVILDRKVKLDLAKQRGVYTPSSSFEKFNQRGGHAQGGTLYVRGFDCSHGFDSIRSALEKHFGKCGEISRISIPRDHESGAPRGVAFIDFPDGKAFSQAFSLSGSLIEGCKIIVEEAKKKRGDGREGSGYGGGWGRDGGSGGGESGSGGGWSRGNDYGGGSGRASGGWHREGGWHGDGGWHREGGSRGIMGRGSDHGGGCGRDGGSGGGWSRGNDYGGGSGRASGGWHREGGWHGDGGWHREGGSRGIMGRGSDHGGGCGRDGGSGGGWSRGNDYGGGSGRASGGWHREGGWHGDGGWRREGGSRGIMGRGSIHGGGRFSSSHVGRFSGGSRGGSGRP